MNFKEFLIEVELSQPIGLVIPNTAFGALPTTWTGSEAPELPAISGGFVGSPYHHQKADLLLPTVTKTAQIQFMNEKSTPIVIFLNDNTRLYLPYDDFKRIKGEPKVGKTITVIFQRRPEDKTEIPSQIQSIHCF